MLTTSRYQRMLAPYLPPHRSVPSVYTIRARRLLATNQRAVPAPALRIPEHPIAGSLTYNGNGGHGSPRLGRKLFFTFHDHVPPGHVHSFVCPGCGRSGMATSELFNGVYQSAPYSMTTGSPRDASDPNASLIASTAPYQSHPRPVCSHACDVALRLYYYDCLALSGLPRFHAHGAPHPVEFDPYPILSFDQAFSPPTSAHRKRTTDPAAPSTVPTNMPQSLLAGRFARHEGIYYLASLIVPIGTLVKTMRDLMSAVDDKVVKLPVAKSAPVVPDISVSATPDLASLSSNPVIARSAQIVLEQLEQANAFLNGGDGAPSWDKDKVKLFLGLYQRVTPALSAQLNINSNPPSRSPSEMTREELEAAIAARAAGTPK